MADNNIGLTVKTDAEESLDFSNELYDELRSLIRGTLIRQTDSE